MTGKGPILVDSPPKQDSHTRLPQDFQPEQAPTKPADPLAAVNHSEKLANELLGSAAATLNSLIQDPEFNAYDATTWPPAQQKIYRELLTDLVKFFDSYYLNPKSSTFATNYYLHQTFAKVRAELEKSLGENLSAEQKEALDFLYKPKVAAAQGGIFNEKIAEIVQQTVDYHRKKRTQEHVDENLIATVLAGLRKQGMDVTRYANLRNEEAIELILEKGIDPLIIENTHAVGDVANLLTGGYYESLEKITYSEDLDLKTKEVLKRKPKLNVNLAKEPEVNRFLERSQAIIAYNTLDARKNGEIRKEHTLASKVTFNLKHKPHEVKGNILMATAAAGLGFSSLKEVKALNMPVDQLAKQLNLVPLIVDQTTGNTLSLAAFEKHPTIQESKLTSSQIKLLYENAILLQKHCEKPIIPFEIAVNNPELSHKVSAVYQATQKILETFGRQQTLQAQKEADVTKQQEVSAKGKETKAVIGANAEVEDTQNTTPGMGMGST